MVDKIFSYDNKLVKFAKKLYNDKKVRDTNNRFIVDSFRITKDLISNGKKIDKLLVSEKSKYYNQFNNIEKVVIEDKIFNSIIGKDANDGVIGIFEKVQLDKKIGSKIVVLDNLQNPGNVGNIIRTSVAFGIDTVILSGEGVDIFNPTTIKMSMGACLYVNILVTTDLSSTIDKLKKSNIFVYSTAINSNAKNLNQVEKHTDNFALIFGNEGNGLKENIIRKSDECIYIKMNSKIESLNVASAAAIIIYSFSN